MGKLIGLIGYIYDEMSRSLKRDLVMVAPSTGYMAAYIASNLRIERQSDADWRKLPWYELETNLVRLPADAARQVTWAQSMIPANTDEVLFKAISPSLPTSISPYGLYDCLERRGSNGPERIAFANIDTIFDEDAVADLIQQDLDASDMVTTRRAVYLDTLADTLSRTLKAFSERTSTDVQYIGVAQSALHGLTPSVANSIIKHIQSLSASE